MEQDQLLVRRVLFAIFVLCMLNFITFIVVASKIGGDAVNGRVVAGRYFLATHGRLTEVSRDVFTYSLWHTRSLFLTHPLALLTGWLASRTMMTG